MAASATKARLPDGSMRMPSGVAEVPICEPSICVRSSVESTAKVISPSGRPFATSLNASVPACTLTGPSKVFAPDMTKLPNGSERWQGSNGTLATGEAVGFHESAVPAGTPKVELHVIKHSELLMVAEGTLSVEHDGVVDEAKPGAVIYVAYGTNHRVWNSGTTTARYFVIQIGGDTKKA